MKVTNAIFTKSTQGKKVATAIVVFDDNFVVKGYNIINGQNGLFVGWPSRKVGAGYESLVICEDKDTSNDLNSQILGFYNDAVKTNNLAPEPPQQPWQNRNSQGGQKGGYQNRGTNTSNYTQNKPAQQMTPKTEEDIFA